MIANCLTILRSVERWSTQRAVFSVSTALAVVDYGGKDTVFLTKNIQKKNTKNCDRKS
jgi:hypothetical protein